MNTNTDFDYKLFLQSHIVDKEQLDWKCPVDLLNFQSTAELKPLDKIIGQPRAIGAIELGAKIKSKGYNIFVSGLSGTGRFTTVKKILDNIKFDVPVMHDYCYVNNFSDPDFPRLITLPAGIGKTFAKDINKAVLDFKDSIVKYFNNDIEYNAAKQKAVADYQKQYIALIAELDAMLKENGCVRVKVKSSEEEESQEEQYDIYLLIDDKPVSLEELAEKFNKGGITAEEIGKYENILNEAKNLFYINHNKKKLAITQDLIDKLLKLRNEATEKFFDLNFNSILKNYTQESVKNYISDMRAFVIENVAYFLPSPAPATDDDSEADDDDDDNGGGTELESIGIDAAKKKNFLDLFSVNVILDNSETTTCPIINENNPTFTNLFGTIERSVDVRGFWKTDFTKIKAGSLLRANNGFLIVNAIDLFSENDVWTTLKRVLLNEKLEIQANDTYFQMSQLHIKPEAIDINLKVVIIGGLSLYRYLYHNEKGFKKIFKINAQFDYETDNKVEMLQHYAPFITYICNKEKLKHFSPDGVAAVIEWGVKYAGTKDKITLKFSEITDLLREASFLNEGDRLTNRDDVRKAIELREYRSNMFSEKNDDFILKGITMIDSDGARVGQINGLTVLDTGLYDFGQPSRITAVVAAGNTGVINIEREAEMSGSIHNKAVLILSGILRDLFAKKNPLTLTASISFEQSYGGVDGDSATAAEIYVILSALTGIPIKQNIAITGSVNQLGDVQPIGGANEKIKGFYKICKERGLTGTQGVLLPALNINDLMLDKEIIDDIANDKFHIWSFSRIEEGISVMMGLPAGKADQNGVYPSNTVLGIAQQKLEELRKFEKDDIFEKILNRRKRPIKPKKNVK